jgi:hypothetical protein
MLQEFARCYNLKTGTLFDIKRRQIRYVPLTIHYSHLFLLRCLAHIINLATQAVISTCSKSKYYSGDPEDVAVPEDVGTSDRDEIGVICAICVKVSLTDQLPFISHVWNRHDLPRNASNSSGLFKSASAYALASCCLT